MMTRRTRMILLVAVVLLLAGAAALLFVGRGQLDDARREVDRTWTPLRTPLSARYLKLAAVDAALREGGGGDRAVAGDLQRQLGRWGQLQQADGGDVEAEVRAANDLEGTALRLFATVESSDRLKTVEALNNAIFEYHGATAPAPAVTAYNDRVNDYQDTRDHPLWGPSAGLFGYDARSVLVLAG